MITIERYTEVNKTEWNNFVSSSKNGIFFFNRDFMDYHSDRFQDHSLIFRKDNNIIALLPANEKANQLISHGGLTFGGIISNSEMTTSMMIMIFDELKIYCLGKNFTKLVYKVIPNIYHILPAEEDLYALFRHRANLVRRDVTTVIKAGHMTAYQQRRIRSIKKAVGAHTVIKEAENNSEWESYWKILTDVLENRHQVKPVHTLEEILKLKILFPDNIKLMLSLNENKINAGVVLFIHDQNIHAQYICVNDEGRNLGSLDMLFDMIIKTAQEKQKHFDFGISTESNGTVLNEGLIDQKEGFGGRSVVHDFYELNFN